MAYSRNLSRWSMVLASLAQYPKLFAPIALGISAAAATMIGALLVGDSLRGSLRFLALDRIGSIEQIVLAPNFFSKNAAASIQPNSLAVQPLIVFPGTSVEFKKNQMMHRASSVMTLGIEDRFWELSDSIDAPSIQENEVFINEAIATELGVAIGDKITIQIPAPSAVSADNPLGKRDSESVAIANLQVMAILPNRSLARFDLQSSQRNSLNVFVSSKTIQNALSRPDQFNSLILSSSESNTNTGYNPDAGKMESFSISELPLSLSDLGFHLDRHLSSDPNDPTKIIYDYFQLTSDRMMIPPEAVNAVDTELGVTRTTKIFAYLANGIQSVTTKSSPSIPYSIVAGIEFDHLGSDRALWQYRTNIQATGSTADNQICFINQWLAEHANLKVGDDFELAYFQSENQDGKEVELTTTFRVGGIVPITQPDQPYRGTRPATYKSAPTVFNDPNMTPSVAGITDQDSISDWETPFPLTRSVSSADDQYWNDFRLTPKLFIPIETAKKLFGSRFGNVTSLRIAADIYPQVELEARLTKALQSVAPELGWNLIPLRKNQLAAASGTTPFDGLFLALSFFVIAAALMLIFLLVRLSVEQRTREWGILKAIGWSDRKIRTQIVLELLPAIGIGVSLSILFGAVFCWAILNLLSGRWLGAIGVPFLSFYWSSRSIAIGTCIGALTALLTIWLSLSYLSKKSTIDLLRQSTTSTQRLVHPPRSRWKPVFRGMLLIIAVVLPMIAGQLEGPAQAGAFLGSGFCLLVSLLLLYSKEILGRPQQKRSVPQNQISMSMTRLAVSSMTRNGIRSLLAVSLISVAVFLLLSVSLFHVEPDERGTGGFALIAKSDLPISRDINDESVRVSQLGTTIAQQISKTMVVPMRLRVGDNAGCSNLYQASQPQVLGVNKVIQQLDRNAASDRSASRFAWASYGSISPLQSPWSLLELTANGTEQQPIPVILDKNTALWGLHLAAKVGEIFSYEYDGKRIHFQTVGLLQNTILQGYLLIDESNFKMAFPAISGSRFFLFQTNDPLEKVATVFESGWSNEGLDISDSKETLAQLLAVQNTYLSAFQSLGSLGLILGTFGLAVVQVRSIIERSGEIGLMRALGFNSRRINNILMTEHLLLLMSGIAIGTTASLFAVLFALLRQQSTGGIFWPLSMLGVVVAVGLGAGFLAIRQASKIPVLAALRGL